MIKRFAFRAVQIYNAWSPHFDPSWETLAYMLWKRFSKFNEKSFAFRAMPNYDSWIPHFQPRSWRNATPLAVATVERHSDAGTLADGQRDAGFDALSARQAAFPDLRPPTFEPPPSIRALAPRGGRDLN